MTPEEKWKRIAMLVLHKLGGEVTISKSLIALVDPSFGLTEFQDTSGVIHLFLTKNGQRWKP